MSNYTEFLFQIIICFLLSSCIGIERQFRRRLVGLRTIILVSLGAFLFVRFTYAFPDADGTRIAAQVVAGIGFLGAGVIIKDNKSVKYFNDTFNAGIENSYRISNAKFMLLREKFFKNFV